MVGWFDFKVIHTKYFFFFINIHYIQLTNQSLGFLLFMHRLKIRRAMPSDTGNYTCVPTIAKSSSVYVHVIIGKYHWRHCLPSGIFIVWEKKKKKLKLFNFIRLKFLLNNTQQFHVVHNIAKAGSSEVIRT